MENNLQVFNNGVFNVRTISDKGTIFFVAKDVAEALDYSESGISNMGTIIAHVPEIWKGRKRITTPDGEQEMLCLTEQGLYFFLGRSDKSKALPYQMWIASDVVPSIRQTGNYSLKKENPALPAGVLDGAKMIFELAGLKDNQLTLAVDKVYRSYTGKSALSAGEVQLEAPVKEHAYTPSELAEILGVGSGRKGARFVNKLLLIAKLQDKIAGKYWQPTKDGMKFCVMLDTNKKHSDGSPVRQVKWNFGVVKILEQLL